MTGTDTFEEFSYLSSDGLRLAARIYGAAGNENLPVVCLPGLTRNARDFHELALHLSQTHKKPRRVVAFDYRGRGRSEHDRNWRNYEVAVEAGDIVAGLTALGIEHAAFIGTSRGGLVIMALTAIRPALLKTVILNDIGPVLDGAGLAHIQSYLKRAPRPASFEDAVRIQKQINGDSFSALTDADLERYVRAFYRQEKHGLVPDLDPAVARGTTGIDLDKPLPTLWPQFMGLAQVPVMAIRGANSKLLSDATLSEMQKRHPALTAITVEGQAHAPLLETAGLPEKIASFIDKADR